MKILKPIFNYLTWILIAMILGIAYMRLLLGSPSKINYKGFDYLVGVYYYHGLVFVGTIIGIFIVFFFFRKTHCSIVAIPLVGIAQYKYVGKVWIYFYSISACGIIQAVIGSFKTTQKTIFSIYRLKKQAVNNLCISAFKI